MDLRHQRLHPPVEDLRESRNAPTPPSPAHRPRAAPGRSRRWTGSPRRAPPAPARTAPDPVLSETEISARRMGTMSVMAADRACSALQPQQVQRPRHHLRLVVAFQRPLAARRAHARAQRRVGRQPRQRRGQRRDASPGGTSSPSPPAPPARAGRGRSVATTGRPVSIASITDIGRPSKWLGRTKMSAAASTSRHVVAIAQQAQPVAQTGTRAAAPPCRRRDRKSAARPPPTAPPPARRASRRPVRDSPCARPAGTPRRTTTLLRPARPARRGCAARAAGSGRNAPGLGRCRPATASRRMPQPPRVARLRCRRRSGRCR